MLTSDSSSDSGWFDSHCHLNDLTNFQIAWQEARQRGIRKYLIPGTHPQQWASVSSAVLTNVYCAFGTHPWFTKNAEAEAKSLLEQLHTSSAVAVGEIGLDYYPSKQPRPEKALQLECFERQLEIAKTKDLPVIIHSVKAHQDVIRLLKSTGVEKGIIHAFSGTQELASQFLDCGMLLGIGPQLLRAKKLRKVVKELPRERVLLETDSPYMPLDKGSVNPLLDILEVANCCGDLWRLDNEALQSQLEQNAQVLFGTLD